MVGLFSPFFKSPFFMVAVEIWENGAVKGEDKFMEQKSICCCLS